jgi:hypothetical protein
MKLEAGQRQMQIAHFAREFQLMNPASANANGQMQTPPAMGPPSFGAGANTMTNGAQPGAGAGSGSMGIPPNGMTAPNPGMGIGMGMQRNMIGMGTFNPAQQAQLQALQQQQMRQGAVGGIPHGMNLNAHQQHALAAAQQRQGVLNTQMGINPSLNGMGGNPSNAPASASSASAFPGTLDALRSNPTPTNPARTSQSPSALGGMGPPPVPARASPALSGGPMMGASADGFAQSPVVDLGDFAFDWTRV